MIPGMCGPIAGLLSGGRSQTTILDAAAKAATITIGGDNVTYTSSAATGSVRATTSKAAGKPYLEWIYLNASGATSGFGLCDAAFTTYTNVPGAAGNSCEVGGNTSLASGGYTLAVAAYTTPFATNDIIGWAIDIPGGKVWVSVNGVYVQGGNPAAGTTPFFTFTGGSTVYPIGWANAASGTGRIVPWATTYAPPSGFTLWDA